MGYQDHIFVSHVSQPGTNEDLGGVKQERLGDIAAEGVPVIPPHRWCASEAIIDCADSGREKQESKGGLGMAHFEFLKRMFRVGERPMMG